MGRADFTRGYIPVAPPGLLDLRVARAGLTSQSTGCAGPMGRADSTRGYSLVVPSGLQNADMIPHAFLNAHPILGG